MFHLMRVFEIDLDVSLPRSTLQRYRFIVLGLMSLIFMEASQFKFNHSSSTLQFNLTSIKRWLQLLIIYERAVWDILFPISMFYATLFKWEKLWKKAKKMEKFFNYQTTSYLQLRKVSMALSASVLILVCIIFQTIKCIRNLNIFIKSELIINPGTLIEIKQWILRAIISRRRLAGSNLLYWNLYD